MTQILYDKIYRFPIRTGFKSTESVNREISNIRSLTEDRFDVPFMAICLHHVSRNIEAHRISINFVKEIESKSKTISFKLRSAIKHSIFRIHFCMRKMTKIIHQSYFSIADNPQFQLPTFFNAQNAFRFKVSFDQPLQIVGFGQTHLTRCFRFLRSNRIFCRNRLVRRLIITNRFFRLCEWGVDSWVKYVYKVRQFFSSFPHVGNTLCFSRQKTFNIFGFRWKANPLAIRLMFILQAKVCRHKLGVLSGAFPVIDSDYAGSLYSALFIGTEKVESIDRGIERKEFAPRFINGYGSFEFDTIGTRNPNHWQRPLLVGTGK